jgi:hypothetical protein
MIQKNLTQKEREGLSNPYFYDRVYAVIAEENQGFSHGNFILKIEMHGIIKVLKSLNLYKTTGRGENKKTLIHPRLELIINTTIADSEIVAKTVISMVNGDYSCLPNFDLNFTDYDKLPFRAESIETKYEGGFKTYLILNRKNNLTKIGKSKKVFDRFQCLSNEFGDDLELLGYANKDNELKLHYTYRNHRVFGEWFNLDESMIKEITSEYDFELLYFSNKTLNS